MSYEPVMVYFAYSYFLKVKKKKEKKRKERIVTLIPVLEVKTKINSNGNECPIDHCTFNQNDLIPTVRDTS